MGGIAVDAENAYWIALSAGLGAGEFEGWGVG
jgi:hypothetical protein